MVTHVLNKAEHCWSGEKTPGKVKYEGKMAIVCLGHC